MDAKDRPVSADVLISLIERHSAIRQLFMENIQVLESATEVSDDESDRRWKAVVEYLTKDN